MSAHNSKDISGKVFGKLTAIRKENKDSDRRWRWLCSCECGKEAVVGGRELRTGTTKSCGCLRRNMNVTHGMARHSGGRETRGLYQSWADAKQRCSNPKVKAYKRYGGRGIVVCARWQLFANFKEDMEEGWSPGMTLDRIDSEGNYAPDNCQWLTLSENSRKGRGKA